MIDIMIEALQQDESVRRVTNFVSPTFAQKVTRQRRLDKRYHSETFIVTMGRPNYAEHERIKKQKLLGTPFPFQHWLHYPVTK